MWERLAHLRCTVTLQGLVPIVKRIWVQIPVAQDGNCNADGFPPSVSKNIAPTQSTNNLPFN